MFKGKFLLTLSFVCVAFLGMCKGDKEVNQQDALAFLLELNAKNKPEFCDLVSFVCSYNKDATLKSGTIEVLKKRNLIDDSGKISFTLLDAFSLLLVRHLVEINKQILSVKEQDRLMYLEPLDIIN